MELKPCLICGGQNVQIKEGWTDWWEKTFIVECPDCGGVDKSATLDDAVLCYETERAAIVSRVLAEAVKDAVILHVPPGAVWAGSGDIAPGTYALVPVKEDKP